MDRRREGNSGKIHVCGCWKPGEGVGAGSVMTLSCCSSVHMGWLPTLNPGDARSSFIRSCSLPWTPVQMDRKSLQHNVTVVEGRRTV